jgi:hypothetical protein
MIMLLPVTARKARRTQLGQRQNVAPRGKVFSSRFYGQRHSGMRLLAQARNP